MTTAGTLDLAEDEKYYVALGQGIALSSTAAWNLGQDHAGNVATWRNAATSLAQSLLIPLPVAEGDVIKSVFAHIGRNAAPVTVSVQLVSKSATGTALSTIGSAGTTGGTGTVTQGSLTQSVAADTEYYCRVTYTGAAISDVEVYSAGFTVDPG